MNIDFICLNYLKGYIFRLQKNRKNPPIGKHQPFRIGCIQWARLLTNKLKVSVLAFKRVNVQLLLVGIYMQCEQ